MTATALIEGWLSVESGPFFGVDGSPEWSRAALPSDYFGTALSNAGREGFLGQQYLRLYRLEELRSLNEAYQTSRYFPGLVVFASDGYGEAFAFLRGDRRVLKVPLIPFPVEGDDLDVVAPDFKTFAEFHISPPATLGPSPSMVGLETHLKQPLCFGGDWKDDKNLVMVTPTQHAELTRYWNPLYRDLLKRQNGGTSNAA